MWGGCVKAMVSLVTVGTVSERTCPDMVLLLDSPGWRTSGATHRHSVEGKPTVIAWTRT